MSTTKKLLLAGAVTLLSATANSTSAYAIACPCTPAGQTAQAHMMTRATLAQEVTTMMAELYWAFTQATGQMTSARQVELRQLGGYFDGQIQELHKIKEGEARFQAQLDAEPPRTLCETATGSSGLRAAQINQASAQNYMNDMSTAKIVGRRGTSSYDGPASFANAKFATTMTLYCDPESVNNDVNSPCAASENNPLVDADINPSKSLFASNMTVDTEQFDAAHDLIMNVVLPLSSENTRGLQTQTSDGKITMTVKRGTDARRSVAAASLNGLLADVTPSTQMGAFVRSLQGEEASSVGDGQDNISKRELLSALLSDRVMNGTYHLKLADMSNNVMLLKELNGNLALTQIALNERIKQNRELIALNATLLATLVDANDAQHSQGMYGQIVPISGN